MSLQKSKHPLIHWFSSTDELIKLGFTKAEIKKAIVDAKTKLSDLTDDYNFVEKSKNTSYIEDHPEYYEIIDKDTSSTFREVEYRKGKEWVHEYTAPAIQYRTRSHYNIHDGEILTKLLQNKFKYFKNFKWEVFAMHGEGSNWDIYMKTKKGSLYVPVKALIKKDPKIIKKRMLDYFESYRDGKDLKVENEYYRMNRLSPEDNKGKYETLKQFNKRQQGYYDQEIAPLETTEAKKLFEVMKN